MRTGTCALCGVTGELLDEVALCRNAEACMARVHPAKLRDQWAQEASSLGEVLAALDVTIERGEAGKIPEVVAALPLIREGLQSLATNAAERAAGRG